MQIDMDNRIISFFIDGEPKPEAQITCIPSEVSPVIFLYTWRDTVTIIT